MVGMLRKPLPKALHLHVSLDQKERDSPHQSPSPGNKQQLSPEVVVVVVVVVVVWGQQSRQQSRETPLCATVT